MTRIEREADPEGAHLKPPTPRETGRSLVFIGGFMVFCSLIVFWWVGWDNSAGILGQTVWAALLLGGLVLMLLGYSKRNKRA
jgi:hypothetical protein